jgi:hypothetical protein
MLASVVFIQQLLIYSITSINPLQPFQQTFQQAFPQPFSSTQTATMQLTIVITTLVSFASAAAVSKGYPAAKPGYETSGYPAPPSPPPAPASNTTYSAATMHKRAASVCGGISSALCCQTDVDGAANLDCKSGKSLHDANQRIHEYHTDQMCVAGDVSSTASFKSTCAEEGTTAQCCIVPVGTDALLCTEA